jgi:hypothetical protein
MLMVTPAQAGLQARDLDGNGITDAFYDTTLNITWLRDAHVNGRTNLQLRSAVGAYDLGKSLFP